jgi:hypothetical protein
LRSLLSISRALTMSSENLLDSSFKTLYFRIAYQDKIRVILILGSNE